MATAKPGPLTTAHVQRAFGVGHMTVYNWRMGTPRRPAMPFTETPRGDRTQISFHPSKLEAWAKKNGIEIKVPFDQVLAEGPDAATEIKAAKPKATKAEPKTGSTKPAGKTARKAVKAKFAKAAKLVDEVTAKAKKAAPVRARKPVAEAQPALI